MLAILLISMILFSGCEVKKPVKIALSKGAGSESYKKYVEWLKYNNPNIECVDLYFIDKQKAEEVLKECSGLVLTGGPDVEPSRYGKAGDSSRCEIDFKRDTHEFEIIRKAIELKMPVLGVCRGLQILNVAYGGTLIVDIPSDYDTTVVHRTNEPDKTFHEISITGGSMLFMISGMLTGTVNSNHHQGIENIAPVFIATARTKDNLAEAIEWKKPEGKPFLLAVQWHPERLDKNSKLSRPIADIFLEKALAFSKEFAKK